MAITINGPIINGEETLLTLYNPEELRAYPHWDRLLSMANDTFGIYHSKGFLVFDWLLSDHFCQRNSGTWTQLVDSLIINHS